MQLRSKWSWAIGLAAVTVVGATWLAQPWSSRQVVGLAAVAERLPAPGAPPAASSLRGQAMTAEQVRNRLFHEGSFVGTEPAGDWCVHAAQQLQPCEALRQRIEYYLLGLGEVGVADIRVLVADEARQAHGPVLARQIMALFDKYWQIRTYDWKNHFAQSDHGTWVPVFEEQRAVRRQILGQAWADAFFQQEERHFQAYYAQLEPNQATPADISEPVPRTEPASEAEVLSSDQAAKADAPWPGWDRRLASAHVEWARIQDTPNLSEPQRQLEMQRYVENNFHGNERVRVKALLKL